MFGVTWIARYLAWRIVDYAVSLALEFADKKRKEKLSQGSAKAWAPHKRKIAERVKAKVRITDPRPKARRGVSRARHSFSYLKKHRWGKIALSLGALALLLLGGAAPWLLSGLLFAILGWWMIELWRRPDPEQRFEEKYGIRQELDDL